MFIRSGNHSRRFTRTAVSISALAGGLTVAIGLAAPGAVSADGGDSPPITLPPSFVLPPPSDPVFSLPPITIPPTTDPVFSLPADITIPPTTDPVFSLPADITISPTTDPVITLPTDVTIVPDTAETTVPQTTPPTTDPSVSVSVSPPPPAITVPTAPLYLAAKPGVGSVKLTWNAPSNDGGAPISHYGIERATSAAGPWTNAGYSFTTSFTSTGLTNGVKYYFRVHAMNADAEWGPWSPTKSATPANYPGTPTGLTATPGAQSIKLAWNAPASNGGSTITWYRVNVYDANCVSKIYDFTVYATSTTYSLPNGTDRCFFVQAVNAIGAGPYSNWAEAIAGAPLAPASCQLTYYSYGDYLQVTWTEPTNWVYYPAGYHVEYGNGDGFTIEEVTHDEDWDNDVMSNPPTGQVHAEVSAINGADEHGLVCSTNTVTVP